MSTIVLWVSDLARSAAYYTDLFQAEKPYISEGFASVSGLGNEVLLHLLPEQYRSEPVIGEDNPIKPVFSLDSLERARVVAEAHQCSFKAETMRHGESFYLDGKDPDGHIIQITAQAH